MPLLDKYNFNSISDDEMWKNIDWDSNTHTEERDGKETLVFGPEFMDGLAEADQAIKKILLSDKPAYEWTLDRKNRKCPVATKQASLMPSLMRVLPMQTRGLRFSPYLELLFETASEFLLPHEAWKQPGKPCLDGKSLVGERINEFFAELRRKAASDGFSRLRSQEVDKVRKNFVSAKAYVDHLLKYRSRLLVLRVDLMYQAGQNASIEVVKRDFKRFLDNRKGNKRLFTHMVGYICKLEYGGAGRGYHMHCIFFFDGSAVHGDIFRAEEIGKYWNSVITKGRGAYWNCHRDKRKYKRLAIGMLHHTDTQMLENLDLVLDYLTKKDYYIRPEMNDGRTFRRGEMRQLKFSGVGRPRSSAEAVRPRVSTLFAAHGAEHEMMA